MEQVVKTEFCAALLRQTQLEKNSEKDHKDPRGGLHNLIASFILIISVYNSEWKINQLLAVNKIREFMKSK